MFLLVKNESSTGGSTDVVDGEGQASSIIMLVKFPITLAKCLKYLCLASN